MVEDSIKEFQKAYSWQQWETDTFNDYGVSSPSYSESETIYAVILPLSPEELRNMPEGQNRLDWLKIYTESEINIKDKITYNGEVYEIQKLENWNETPYYKGIMTNIIEDIR